jgi:hypothetical protein
MLIACPQVGLRVQKAATGVVSTTFRGSPLPIFCPWQVVADVESLSVYAIEGTEGRHMVITQSLFDMLELSCPSNLCSVTQLSSACTFAIACLSIKTLVAHSCQLACSENICSNIFPPQGCNALRVMTWHWLLNLILSANLQSECC